MTSPSEGTTAPNSPNSSSLIDDEPTNQGSLPVKGGKLGVLASPRLLHSSQQEVGIPRQTLPLDCYFLSDDSDVNERRVHVAFRMLPPES